jgi:hypothetical protein
MPYYSKKRRRLAHLLGRRFGGGSWTCWTGEPNTYDPLCPPMQPDLGAPEIQHCGYRNQERRDCWMAILAGYGVGAPVPGRALAAAPPRMGHFRRRRAMTGFSAGYAHDGGGGGPYGYPECGEFYGTQNPVRRGERARMLAAGADTRHGCGYGVGAVGYSQDGGGGGPYGYPYETPSGGYGVGADVNAAVAADLQAVNLDTLPAYNVAFPGMDGSSPAPSGTKEGQLIKAKLPDGSTRMMICRCKKCCTVGSGDCWGMCRGWIKGKGSGMGAGTGMPGMSVTAASGKSARAVRRYNLMARSRMAAGMSVGGQHDGGGGSPYGYPELAPTQGVFYGTQNPVRDAMRRRQFPSGRQGPQGFQVGGCSVGGCSVGACGSCG